MDLPEKQPGQPPFGGATTFQPLLSESDLKAWEAANAPGSLVAMPVGQPSSKVWIGIGVGGGLLILVIVLSVVLKKKRVGTLSKRY